MIASMRSLLKHTLDLLFPEPCIHCGSTQNSTLFLCSKCLLELPRNLHPIASPEIIHTLWGMAEYMGPAGTLIRRCKYKPDNLIFREIVHRMESSSLPWEEFDVITHVPTTFQRKFVRGFDQAQILAQLLATSVSIPYMSLLKRHDPKAQSLRTYKQRKEKLSFRFGCTTTPPKKVLVVDDICTTGSTLEACAFALLNEGTEHVYGLVVGY
jgi:ComF family protein